MSKAVVIYSGGMDSRTVLQLALIGNDEVHALSFNYGQRHAKELTFASKVCKELNIPHKIINLDFMADVASNSALTSDAIDVPFGHYEAESMKATVVPNRNAIMLSIAYAYAINNSFDKVYYGAHAGDHAIYPDCTPEFIHTMDCLGWFVSENKINLVVPFMNDTKFNILQKGYKMGVDYADTWTCYMGADEPCGKCGACQERAEAFKILSIKDPLLC